MHAHRRALIFPNPIELHSAGAVRFDMYTIRLVGGVVADEVM